MTGTFEHEEDAEDSEVMEYMKLTFTAQPCERS